MVLATRFGRSPNEQSPSLSTICPCFCCANQTAQEGSNLFGQDNVNYPILKTYAEGSVMEVKVVVSTYHWVSCAALD